MNRKYIVINIAVLFLLLTAATCVHVNAKTKAKLDRKSVTVTEGQTVQLTVTGAKKTVKWSCSPKSVCSVTQDGLVTAKKAGKAVVKAKAGKTTLKCKVKVKKKPVYADRIEIQGDTDVLAPGNTTKLSVSYFPNGAKKERVIWESSDTNLATVEDGTVTAIAVGEVTITARLESNTEISAAYLVHIKEMTTTMQLTTADGGAFIRGVSSVNVKFQLDMDCKDVVVDIVNSSDTSMYSQEFASVSKNTDYNLTWDGTQSGSAVEAGTYFVQIKAGTAVIHSEELLIRNNEFAGGTGSEGHPFLVSTLEQFLAVEKYNGYSFQQTSDIAGNITRTVQTMYGSEENPFEGTYDGNGHAIIDLNIKGQNNANTALFGVVGSNGKLNNVSLQNASIISSGDRSAGLVRVNHGKVINCTMSDCKMICNAENGAIGALLCDINAEKGIISGCKVLNSTIALSASTKNGVSIYGAALVVDNNGILTDCMVENADVNASFSHDWYTYLYLAGITRLNTGTMTNCGAKNVNLSTNNHPDTNYQCGICQENEGILTACYFTDGTALETGVGINKGVVNP